MDKENIANLPNGKQQGFTSIMVDAWIVGLQSFFISKRKVEQEKTQVVSNPVETHAQMIQSLSMTLQI